MNEQWKPAPGWGGLYEVSDHGRVRSLGSVDVRGRQRQGRILRLATHSRGYLVAAFSHRGRKETLRVHRLVLLAFRPEPNCEQLQVNHIDGCKTNNVLSNLEWCSALHNQRHAMRMGLARKAVGEAAGAAKISTLQALEIYRLSWAGGMRQEDIAQKHGVHRQHVSAIKHGHAWAHATGHRRANG